VIRSILERRGASEWKTRHEKFRADWRMGGTYKLVREAPMTFFLFTTIDPGRDALTRAAELETRVALTRVAVAAERYRVRHGRYAEAVSDLVPAFLDEMPRDWQTGQPLQYTGCNETFALYALGWDGRDDGGSTETRPKVSRYYDIWSGKDAVWLRRATQEEVAQWEQRRAPGNRGRASHPRSSSAAMNQPATNLSNPLRTNFSDHPSPQGRNTN
jgi:hypothetical protein